MDEPLIIEMGIGWKRDPKDPTQLVSANPSDYAAEITRLRKALMPFAHYFDLNCDERRDDDALEVPIGDLRRARAALTSTDSNPTEKTEGSA